MRIIVPYAAGGTSDALARVIGAKLQELLGQPVVVEARPGANGTLGSQALARSAADGYTLMLVNSSHVINPVLMQSIPYDAIRDFRPVSILAASPMAIIAGPQQPFTTMQELLAYARAKPSAVTIGNSEGTTMLLIELLKQRAGLNMVQANYKGGAALLTDVAGGHVPVGVLGTVPAAPLYREGKIRMLAVTTGTRSPALPDVPTVAESGVPGFDMKVWFALMAPVGVPDAVIDRLQRESARTLADPGVRTKIAELGADVWGTSPAEAASALKAEAELWAGVARQAGIKAQ